MRLKMWGQSASEAPKFGASMESLAKAEARVAEAEAKVLQAEAEEARLREEAGPGAVWDVQVYRAGKDWDTPVTAARSSLQARREDAARAGATLAQAWTFTLEKAQEQADRATARSLWAAAHKHNWVAPRGERPRKDSYGVWRVECRCDDLHESPVEVNGKPFAFTCDQTRRFEGPTEKGPWKASFGQ